MREAEQRAEYMVNTSKRRNVRFGEVGRWILDNHLETLRKRRTFDKEIQRNPVAKGAEAVAVTALESIPFIGDGATAFQGLVGKTFDGMPLSVVERIIYFALSIPPPFNPIDLPARPIVALYHEIDKHVLTPLLLDILGPEAQKEEKDVEQDSSLRAASTERLRIASHEPVKWA